MPPSPLQQTARYLAPIVLAPIVGVFTLVHLALPNTTLLLTVPLSTLLAVPSIPLWLLVSRAWIRFNNRRAATRLGAELPPWVEDDSWFGRGNVKIMLENLARGLTGEHISIWTGKYGHTFLLDTMFEDRIQTDEPEHIKAILATSFPKFEKGPKVRSMFGDVLGDGVFNADGDMWKFHRGITRPFFSKDRISDFEVFEEHTQKALYAIGKRLAEGQPVDVQDLVSRFTIDSATTFLFGSDVRSLDVDLPRLGAASSVSMDASDEFARAFMAAQLHMARRSRFGPAWPLFELFEGKHQRNMEVMKAYTDPIVDAAVERARARQASGEKDVPGEVKEGETMLDYMVKSTKDKSLLRDETLNILIAGRDTTASLLTSAIYELSRHPHVLAKLRAEILGVVGADDVPRPDDIRSMRYLRAVLNEVLRLWPPVPYNGRTCREAALLPNKEPGRKPFYVPAGTRCTYSVFNMHRRKDLWGPDALEFDPERFLDERVKLHTANNFIFLPFNAGPRICLGQQFAYNEASFFLIRLLQAYEDIALVLDAQPPVPLTDSGEKTRDDVWMRAHLTLYAEGGVWVRLNRAGN